MTPEGRVKQFVKKVLLKFGAFYWMPRGTTLGLAGVSDFCILYKGVFLALETKAAYKKISKVQRRFLQNVADNGGIPLIIYPEDIEYLTHVFWELEKDLSSLEALRLEALERVEKCCV